MTRLEVRPVHPGPALRVTDDHSLEITAKDAAAVEEAARRIAPGTFVSVAFLPGETLDARIAATRAIREAGLRPMPHFSARRIASRVELERYLERLVAEAGVRRCFIIAGDPAEAEGPFADSPALLATGLFERAGIRTIGVGGHPEGHPHMNDAQCFLAHWYCSSPRAQRTFRVRSVSARRARLAGTWSRASIGWLRW